MQNITIRKGNLFNSDCQTLVNTVNCVGVMGAGIALEFRLRHPPMFQRYAELCTDGKFDIGRLWLYKAPTHWVLNFPTKRHWRNPSKPEYLHQGLQHFVQTHVQRGIVSAAFPLLGASHGGLHARQSLAIMTHHLARCAIPIEIWEYDASADDDLFRQFKARFLALQDAGLAHDSGLRAPAIRHLRAALDRPDICQLNQLARVRGIGDKTLEKVFRFMCQPQTRPQEDAAPRQLGLDLHSYR